MIPALDTAYGMELPAGRRPATEVTLMTEPAPLAFRAGTLERVMCQVPMRLVDRILSQTSSVAASRSACGISWVVPALLTRMSRRPYCARVASTSAWQAAASATLACT